MRILGFGRDLTFFTMLKAQAEMACHAAEHFKILVNDLSRACEHARQIEDIELQADELIHQLANKISSTFITPLDKEDLNDLAGLLDDIVDAIDDAAACITICRISESRPELLTLAEILSDCCQAVGEGIDQLPNSPDRDQCMKVINRIHEQERAGDLIYRQCLGKLFNDPSDPLQIFKWKELHDWVEEAIDRCERMAIVLERIAVKYG